MAEHAPFDVSVFKKLAPFSMTENAVLVWTVGQTREKKMHFQIYQDQCGRGLSHFAPVLFQTIIDTHFQECNPSHTVDCYCHQMPSEISRFRLVYLIKKAVFKLDNHMEKKGDCKRSFAFESLSFCLLFRQDDRIGCDKCKG